MFEEGERERERQGGRVERDEREEIRGGQITRPAIKIQIGALLSRSNQAMSTRYHLLLPAS